MPSEERTLSARLAWWAERCEQAMATSVGDATPGAFVAPDAVAVYRAYGTCSDMLSAVSQWLREESERAVEKLEASDDGRSI